MFKDTEDAITFENNQILIIFSKHTCSIACFLSGVHVKYSVHVGQEWNTNGETEN